MTGGSRGIGAATAEVFVRNGATVFIAGRDMDKCQETASMLNDIRSGSTTPLQLDVGSPESIGEAFRHIFKTTKRLDVLVNNAGIMREGVIGTIDSSTIDSVLATNTKGALLCLQSAVRLMQRERYGAIVNVTSVLASHGARGQAVYSASKAALEAITRAAAIECAPWGIRVNAVAPGWIDTEMVDGFSESDKNNILARVPTGRIGQPQEVAQAIAFLASDQASYITGSILSVDGGYIP